MNYPLLFSSILLSVGATLESAGVIQIGQSDYEVPGQGTVTQIRMRRPAENGQQHTWLSIERQLKNSHGVTKIIYHFDSERWQIYWPNNPTPEITTTRPILWNQLDPKHATTPSPQAPTHASAKPLTPTIPLGARKMERWILPGIGFASAALASWLYGPSIMKHAGALAQGTYNYMSQQHPAAQLAIGGCALAGVFAGAWKVQKRMDPVVKNTLTGAIAGMSLGASARCVEPMVLAYFKSR